MNVVQHELRFTMEDTLVRQAIISAARKKGYSLTFGPGEFDFKVLLPDAGKAYHFGALSMRVYIEAGGTFKDADALAPRGIVLREDS